MTFGRAQFRARLKKGLVATFVSRTAAGDWVLRRCFSKVNMAAKGKRPSKTNVFWSKDRILSGINYCFTSGLHDLDYKDSNNAEMCIITGIENTLNRKIECTASAKHRII